MHSILVRRGPTSSMQRLVALLVGALFELSQVSGSYVNREHFAPSTWYTNMLASSLNTIHGDTLDLLPILCLAGTESVLMQMLSLSSRGTKICPQPTCGVGECSWPGVSCEKGKVVELALPGAGLRMQFPSNLFSLSELRVLDLRNNELVRWEGLVWSACCANILRDVGSEACKCSA